jgi:hypothetical protein
MRMNEKYLKVMPLMNEEKECSREEKDIYG